MKKSAQKLTGHDPYRQLQQHLDTLPVGFPASPTQADIRLLKHIFSPDQARIATLLSHRPRPLEEIAQRAKDRGLTDDSQTLEKELTALVKKGGIEVQRINGKKQYLNSPLVVGMYELQAGRLTPEFIRDFKAYSSEKGFGISFLSTARPQMRTIPIHKSIPIDTRTADYDQVSQIIDRADPPFVILPCICRKKKAMLQEPCRITPRTETCLAMGQVAHTLVEMNLGRQIQREDARQILEKNQEEGLVLQPANTKQSEFICSCCGCCCSMLALQKELPSPLDFWAANFQARMDMDACIGCGKCIKSCQTRAFEPGLEGSDKKTPGPVFNSRRCIGCGLCVPACPVQAIDLVPVKKQTQPPRDREELNAQLLAKKGKIAEIKTLGKLAWAIIETRDFRLLK